MHSIAAFESIFLARRTTWIALAFCVVNLLYYLWLKQKRPVTWAHRKNLCCMWPMYFQKNPRYGDPLRLGRNSHVRPWANCPNSLSNARSMLELSPTKIKPFHQDSKCKKMSDRKFVLLAYMKYESLSIVHLVVHVTLISSIFFIEL